MSPSHNPPVVILKVASEVYLGDSSLINCSESYPVSGTIKEFIIQTGELDEEDKLIEYRSKKPFNVIHTYSKPGEYTITAIARDSKGSEGYAKMTIAVLKIAPPPITLTVPNQSASYNSDTGDPIAVNYPAEPTVSGGTPPYTITYGTDEATTLFPIGSTEVEIFAVDSEGHVGSGILTITVVDTSEPDPPDPVPPDPPTTFTATPSTIDEGNSSLLELIIPSTYTDVRINSVPAIQINPTTYQLTVSPTVSTVYQSMANLNGSPVAMPQVTVTVNATPDPPPPDPYPIVITPPANQSVESEDGNPVSVSWDAAVVTGGIGPYTIIYKLGTTTITSPHNFSVGVNTVTINVTDSAGIQRSSSFNITIFFDNPGEPYYNTLSARPDVRYLWPMHSAAEISTYEKRTKVPPNIPVVYDLNMNAVRQEINPAVTGSNTPQQIHLDLIIPQGLSFLFTMDYYWSSGWTYLGPGYIPNAEKTYRFDLPDSHSGFPPVWIAPKHFWQNNVPPGSLSEFRVNAPNAFFVLPPTTYSSETPGPQVAFYEYANRWTRSWYYYDAGNQELSVWAADSVQGIVQKLNRIKYGFPSIGLGTFRLEDDTSYNQVPALNPQSFHWTKNIVVLQNLSYSDVVALLSTSGL